MKSIRTWLVLTISLALIGIRAEATEIPGLPGGNRAWVAMLVEDHKGMQEVVWDSAFTDLQAAGPFLKDHSYVIRTGSKPSLMDLGCWDATGAHGGEYHHLAASNTLAWTMDRKGVLLKSGTHATWLPALGGFDGDELPSTFRGAYLNWLLTHRSTTPSIPSETRWQRVQRGALAMAAQLFNQGGGKPAYRLVGVGTSGHLLIPPGESLNAIQNAIRKMHPRTHDGKGGHGKDDDHDRDDDRDHDCDHNGSMLKALRRAYESMAHAKGPDRDREHQANDGARHDKGGNGHDKDGGHDGSEDHHGDCDHDDAHDHHGGGQSNGCGFSIVLPVSDGTAFGQACGSARAYEAHSSYPDMLQAVGNIAATGQAVVWSWNVEGPGTWDKVFAAKGKGQAFEGDAVAEMVSALKAWMAQSGSAPALSLSLSNPVITRNPNEILMVTLSSAATSATLNGQPLVLTGLITSVPLTLVEGPNIFTVAIQSSCGSTQASISVVLDTVAPLVSLQSPAEGWRSNTASVTLSGRVNDPTALLTVNGQPLSQNNGAFTSTLTPAEGPFAMVVVATDLAGNRSSVVRTIILDRTAPRITLTRPVPTLTRTPKLDLQGLVDDLSAILTLNGVLIPMDAAGGFTTSVALAEGPNAFTFLVQDRAGNIGSLTVITALDTQAPMLTVLSPSEGLRTNAPQIAVTGSVDDPLAQVKVNGQATAVEASGAFTTTLSPAEGPFTILVTAPDPIGNQSQETRHILIDRTAPLITLTRPVPSLVAVATLSLQGLVDDPTARLTLNGAALALDAQGAFTVEAPLSEGANFFHFEAADLTGNIGVLDAKTLRDTIAPVVTLDSPQDGLITSQRSLLVKGRVDDPTARLLVAGQSLSPAEDGGFEIILTPAEGPLMIVALATDPAGNTGHAVRSVTLDWTPPLLAWTTPTPAEGAKVSALPVLVAATVSESATVLLNGQPLTLESGSPYLAKTSLSPAEGVMTLSLDATDRAGNAAHIERHFEVGLTAPKIVIESPDEGLQTQEASAVLAGRVDCGDFFKPLTLTLNGNAVALATDGRFSLPIQLLEGANLCSFTATNAFGLQGLAVRTLNRFTTPFGVQIDWPLDGLATPGSTVEVRGRVRRAGTTVTVNGLSAPVEPVTLVFKVVVPLQPGVNILRAKATDGAGNQGEAQVRTTCAPPAEPAATYRWDLPANASTSRTRTVHVMGQADLPGVTSIRVNGLPMSLVGTGKDGKFAGDVPLEARGRNVLFLEARTLGGATLTERREASFVPELPRIRLQAPETARPGDSIPIQVSPEPGTQVKAADISWNGRFLGRVTDPFAAVTAQVPGDAAVGSRILVEALATDAEGEQVTARTYVTVYGQGALLVEAYDDQLGLLLKEGLAEVEGGEAQALNATGKAALRTALPQNWIRVSRSGYSPVWRPAGLQVGGVQAAVDARLSPLVEAQPATPGASTGRFGQGALELSFPAGSFTVEGLVSATPLSTQGLPGLLPAGWSAISAWWVDLGTLRPAFAGTAELILPGGAPQKNLVWARWDQGLHAWITLATGLRASDLTGLSISGSGGFALVVPDAGATAPPAAVPNAQLPAFEGTDWRVGLLASGTVDPAILPTTAAIRGARATAKFSVGFADKEPIPSGAIVQVDVLESYALLDSALIEPDGFTQDAVLARWILGVDKDGAPTLKAAQDLGLELPVRMSRIFPENELVDGRIWVGFYHDGVQVAQSGSELLDASGGVVSHDGIQLTLPAHALTGTTLIRLNADQGDLGSLWPELAGQGSLAKSFQLDIVGNLTQGLGLSFDGLTSVPDTAQPMLVARRVIQGERLVVALGGLRKQGSNWTLVVPEGGNPVLEGGAFVVLVPALNWDWISGTALLPSSIAQPLMKKLGTKARMVSVKGLKANANEARMQGMKGMKAKAHGSSSSSSLPLFPVSPSSWLNGFSNDDVAVADVVVTGGFLQSVSGTTGAFAVPAFTPADSSTIPVKGARRDLGVTGSFTAPAPSAGNTLRLSQVPFRVMTIAPAELAEVGVGTVVEVQLSTAVDPATLGQAKLYQEVTAAPLQGLPSAQGPVSVKKRFSHGLTRMNADEKAKSVIGVHPRSSVANPALSDAPQLVEVPLRRSLSQDGRTLLLTPEAPLQLSAVYRVITNGLASVSGELAPAFTRRFKTQSQPQFSDVDLSRIRLSYPTETFDVTVTIPEGAIPAWSLVIIEDPGMGSVWEGCIPPTGDLVFQLKAYLGDQLSVTVQTRDGRSIGGTIGRYVSADGRTTLGVDGGRVEGPNGLAVVVPTGALSAPVELRVEAMDAAPGVAPDSLPDGIIAMPGLRLRASKPEVTFLKAPLIELPLSVVPAGLLTEASTSPAASGNGPLVVCRTEHAALPDGTEDEYHIVMDSAQLSKDGTRIVSLGGLRLPDDPPISLPLTLRTVPGRAAAVAAKANAGEQGSQASMVPGSALLEVFLLGYPLQGATGKASAREQGQPSPMGIQSALFDGPFQEPTYNWASGTVYRNWNGSGRCAGTASASCYGELANAEILLRRLNKSIPAAIQGRLSRGRVVAIADQRGRYTGPGYYTGSWGEWNVPIVAEASIGYFALDPRTGETSLDPGAVNPLTVGFPLRMHQYTLLVTSPGGNPFDPTLTAPRIRAQMVDGTGAARTMFTVGETATLRITTETGSQPVVRGKASGSLTQDFGTLPAELPVTFTQEGTWKVDLLGWTARPVQGAASLSVVVTPAGLLGPSLPGKPTILHKDPSDGDKDIDPSAVVKITFSEPVRGATSSAFSIEVNTIKVPFKVVSNAREVVDAATRVQEVWLMPDQRLTLGATVRVALVSSLLVDQEGLSPDPATWSFTIRGADEVGSLAGVGVFSHMVVHKGRIYAAEEVGSAWYWIWDGANTVPVLDPTAQQNGIRVLDASDPSSPTKGILFGQFGSWDPKSTMNGDVLWYAPFNRHQIVGMRVVPGVSLNGSSRDLLVVATRPWQVVEQTVFGDDVSWLGSDAWMRRHSAVWVYDITGDGQDTEPIPGQTGLQPKMLMYASVGTGSDHRISGLGGAGGMFGIITKGAGMRAWDASLFQSQFEVDRAVTPDRYLRKFAASDRGYFADPKSLVLSNGFTNATMEPGAKPTARSGVITEDANGQPIGFAALDTFSEGMLALIDGKVGHPEALATFEGGGPRGLDARIHDLSAAVRNEYTSLVEVIKGTWQNPSGTEQGTLLLAGTTVGGTIDMNGVALATPGHFWVIKPDLANLASGSAVALGYAGLPGRITRILPDPARMLVGVEAGGRGYIFDLKNLQPNSTGPMTLTPIFDFAVSGAWTLADGLLYDDQTGAKKFAIKNIDGVTMEAYVGLPLLVSSDSLLQGADVQFGEGEAAPETQASARVGKGKTSMARPQQGVAAPSEYVYAMAKFQTESSGYPWLRHYYPELGKMQLSAIVDTSDSNYRQEMTSGKKDWIIQAEAKLTSATGVNESIPVTLLSVSADQTSVTPLAVGTAPLGELRNDGDFRYLKLVSGYNEGPTSGPTKPRFMYMPMEFDLPQAVLDRYSDQMRSDEEDQWQVRVTVKLKRKNPSSGEYEEKLKLKDLSFIVKFNANTTLFDVLRGGVWYHDPSVSGNDIKKPSYNPATVAIHAGSSPLTSRLSTTAALYAGEGDQSPMARAMLEAGKSIPMADLKLDAIQIYLDHVINGLRREIVKPQDGTSQQQFGFLHPRPSIFQPIPEDGQLPVGSAGDALGAYAEKTANAINAIQSFTGEEMKTGVRSSSNPSHWQRDPGAGSGENAFIMPALSQGLMNGGRYNAEAVYFHYLIGYPGFRQRLDSRNGNNALSNLITRELVIGPSKSITDRGRYLAPGEKIPGTIYDQRKRVEDILASIRSRKDKHDPAVAQDFADLAQAIQQQEIVVAYTNDVKTIPFNPGVGILQMALSECWLRWPKATDADFKGSLNAQEMFVADNPVDGTGNLDAGTGKLNWNYEIPDFNQNIYNKMVAFLTGEKYMKDGITPSPYANNQVFRAPRIDLLINGVSNTSTDLAVNMANMQNAITAKQSGTPDYPMVDGKPLPSPVIGVYNLSKKKNQGFWEFNGNLMNFFDLKEAMRETLLNENPDRKVYNNDDGWFNPDGIRLIATLKALVQAQQSVDYKLIYYGYHARKKGYPLYSWDLGTVPPAPVQTEYFLAQPVKDLQGKLLIEKTKATIEEELGVDPKDPQAAALLLAAIERAKADLVPAFRLKLEGEIKELEQIMGGQQLTLHAHSQGALKAAVAHLRNGTVFKIRGNRRSTPIDVSERIHLITYGGAANMFDWTKEAKFRSFTHHVNESDLVTRLGMRSPFWNKTDFKPSDGLLRARDLRHSVILHTSADAPLVPFFTTHKWWTYNCYMSAAPLGCAPPQELEQVPPACPLQVDPNDREKKVDDLQVKGCGVPVTGTK